jgi:guanylate kinase
VHYRFLSRKEFEEGVRGGKFLEHALVHGHLYGTPRRDVEEAVARGKHVLLNIDVQGAEQLRGRKLGEDPRPGGGPRMRMTTIFLLPPDEETLEERLRGRGTEDAGQVSRRLEEARREMLEKEKYDHIVVNRRLEDAVREVLEIVGSGDPHGTATRADS